MSRGKQKNLNISSENKQENVNLPHPLSLVKPNTDVSQGTFYGFTRLRSFPLQVIGN